MNARESILDKIRKLLALSRSANEHEAEVALARAQALMTEHQISEAEALASGQKADPFGVDEHYLVSGYRLRPWRVALAVGIGTACGCKLMTRWKRDDLGRRWQRIVPVGTATDRELCHFLFTWAETELARIGSKACYGKSPAFQKAWYYGAAEGVTSAMTAARRATMPAASSTALVTLNQRAAELEAFFQDQLTSKKPDKKKVIHLDGEGYNAGRQAGSNLNMPGTSGIGAGASPALSMA